MKKASAKNSGKVLIRGKDGRIFALTPENIAISVECTNH